MGRKLRGWKSTQRNQLTPGVLAMPPNKARTSVSAKQDQSQQTQAPTSTGATLTQGELRAHSGVKAGNQNGQVVNSAQTLDSAAKLRWVASREQLKVLLWHFWQEHSCNGKDRNEFDRINLISEISPAWDSAQQFLKTRMLHEGFEADKVERLAEDVLSKVFSDVFDRCHQENQMIPIMGEIPGFA